MTAVSGDDAAGFIAVRLDSYACVNDGVLIEANEQTGLVRWRDKAGEEKRAELGAGSIKIIAKAR